MFNLFSVWTCLQASLFDRFFYDHFEYEKLSSYSRFSLKCLEMLNKKNVPFNAFLNVRMCESTFWAPIMVCYVFCFVFIVITCAKLCMTGFLTPIPFSVASRLSRFSSDRIVKTKAQSIELASELKHTRKWKKENQRTHWIGCILFDFHCSPKYKRGSRKKKHGKRGEKKIRTHTHSRVHKILTTKCCAVWEIERHAFLFERSISSSLMTVVFVVVVDQLI